MDPHPAQQGRAGAHGHPHPGRRHQGEPRAPGAPRPPSMAHATRTRPCPAPPSPALTGADAPKAGHAERRSAGTGCERQRRRADLRAGVQELAARYGVLLEDAGIALRGLFSSTPRCCLGTAGSRPLPAVPSLKDLRARALCPRLRYSRVMTTAASVLLCLQDSCCSGQEYEHDLCCSISAWSWLLCRGGRQGSAGGILRISHRSQQGSAVSRQGLALFPRQQAALADQWRRFRQWWSTRCSSLWHSSLWQGLEVCRDQTLPLSRRLACQTAIRDHSHRQQLACMQLLVMAPASCPCQALVLPAATRRMQRRPLSGRGRVLRPAPLVCWGTNGVSLA